MPSLLTHYYFAEDFIRSSSANDSVISSYREAFRLGSQGPDPLFFSGMKPFKDLNISILLERYGSKLHRLDGSQFIKELLKRAFEIDEPVDRNCFLSFTLGQLGHYLLDSTAHPYVYYFTGFDKKGTLKGKYHYEHSFFEGRIDSAFANYRNQKELIYKPETVLHIEPDQMKIISSNLSLVLSRIFNKKFSVNCYKNGVENMAGLYCYVNKRPDDKNHFGRTVFGQLFIPRNQTQFVFNEDHYTWKNPASGTCSKDSFMELFNKAMKKMEQTYSILVQNNYDFASISDIFNNINYSGTPCGSKKIYKDENSTLIK